MKKLIDKILLSLFSRRRSQYKAWKSPTDFITIKYISDLNDKENLK